MHPSAGVACTTAGLGGRGTVAVNRPDGRWASLNVPSSRIQHTAAVLVTSQKSLIAAAMATSCPLAVRWSSAALVRNVKLLPSTVSILAIPASSFLLSTMLATTRRFAKSRQIPSTSWSMLSE